MEHHDSIGRRGEDFPEAVSSGWVTCLILRPDGTTVARGGGPDHEAAAQTALEAVERGEDYVALWEIVAGPDALEGRPGTSHGWRWRLRRGGDLRRLTVWVSDSAWAEWAAGGAPENVREAIDSCGLSEVQRIRRDRQPPAEISVDA